MSTKTLRKRIALVAVSALGAGLLSVVAVPSANAAVNNGVLQIDVAGNNPFCSATDATGADIFSGVVTTRDSDAGTEVLVAGSGTLLDLNIDADDAIRITGPATVFSYSVGVVVTTSTSGALIVDDTDSGDEIIRLSLNTAGTVSIVVVADGYSGDTFTAGANNSFRITVGGCSALTTYSAANSGVRVSEGIPDLTPAFTTASDNQAEAGNALFINIDAKNKYGSPLVSKVWTASATNGALVDLACGAPEAGTLSFDFNTCAGSTVHVQVDPKAAETGGSTTVTVTYNGATFGTYDLTFLGEAVKMTVIANTVGKVGATGDDGMAWVTLQDSSGRDVPGTLGVVGSSLGSRITGVTELKPAVQDAIVDASPDDVGDIPGLTAALGKVKYGIVGFACSSAAGAGTGTVTLKHTNVVTGDDITLPVTFTCAGGMDTYSVSMDKASYKVGEIATLTITAKDSKGNPVHDFQAVGGTANNISAGGGSLVKADAGTDTFGILAASATGVKTYKLQMQTAGAWNVVVNLAGSTTKSATAAYTITSGSTSLEDVLKAIVSLIASINKQIAALQKALLKKK